MQLFNYFDWIDWVKIDSDFEFWCMKSFISIHVHFMRFIAGYYAVWVICIFSLWELTQFTATSPLVDGEIRLMIWKHLRDYVKCVVKGNTIVNYK